MFNPWVSRIRGSFGICYKFLFYRCDLTKHSRRFSTKCLAYTLAVSTSLYIICRPLATVAADLEENFDNDNQSDGNATDLADYDDGDEEDTMFIPLGWPRLVPGKDYAGDDPEWQTFLKTARNPDRLNSLKSEQGGSLFYLCLVSIQSRFVVLTLNP